jgi:formate dehydrogenase (NADP+) beta subunit
VTEGGRISGVECLEVTSLVFDEEKVPHVETREGSQHVIPADTVIFAIGQRPDIPEGFGLNTTHRSLIEADAYSLATSREGVFAAGDVVNGTSSVIKSIASGRKAAQALDRFLGGGGNIDIKLAPPQELVRRIGKVEGFSALKRCDSPLIPPAQRTASFCKVVCDLDEATAAGEAKRCLQCDLRLKITPIKFWGNY